MICGPGPIKNGLVGLLEGVGKDGLDVWVCVILGKDGGVDWNDVGRVVKVGNVGGSVGIGVTLGFSVVSFVLTGKKEKGWTSVFVGAVNVMICGVVDGFWLLQSD
jgi:hypothetical protein